MQCCRRYDDLLRVYIIGESGGDAVNEIDVRPARKISESILIASELLKKAEHSPNALRLLPLLPAKPEVTPTLKALRSHGLDVVAIHNHMTNSRPMIIFLHDWGRGTADKLATGFKAAIDELGKGGAH